MAQRFCLIAALSLFPAVMPTGFAKSKVTGIVCDPGTFQNCHEVSGVKRPELIHAEDLEVIPSASRERGIAKVKLIVDEKGLPQLVTLVQPFVFGDRPAAVAAEMNQNAIKAVGTYRFKPATLNKVPVPVAITVEVLLR